MRARSIVSLLVLLALLVVLGVYFHSTAHINTLDAAAVKAVPLRQSLTRNSRSAAEARARQSLLALNESLNELQQTLTRISLSSVLVSEERDSLSEPQRDTQSQDQSISHRESRPSVELPQASHSNLRAVIFTMDSITSYEENSRSGGAAGEILIRNALQNAFAHFGVSFRVVRSDEEFSSVRMNEVDIIVLDPWTWAAKGWIPKPNLRGFEKRIFILDFFGSSALRGDSFKIDPKRILTAFKSPFNTFLGYYIDEAVIEEDKRRSETVKKQARGVLWGKDPKYFQGKERLLQSIASHVPLVSTAPRLLAHRNISGLGHQTTESWRELLRESRFLLGLGDPLLGPSAVDAVSVGCMFINPVYAQPRLESGYSSQHPYIAEAFPEAVCSYPENDQRALLECIDRALSTELSPLVPEELRKHQYFSRVKEIFTL